MLKIRGYKSQYSTLNVIKKISKNNLFSISDFVIEMKKLGYVSPRAYISRYLKKGLIEKVKRGQYKLLAN